MKGATPQWQHFSLQTFADAFWRLLNCTWYRQDPFSFKSKTDCFSLGRRIIGQEKWQSRDCPALWEVEDRGGELVHSVLMCVNSFSVFVFCPARRLCLYPCVSKVHTLSNLPASFSTLKLSLSSPLYHTFTPPFLWSWPLLYLIPLPLPPLWLSWPGFLFLTLKSMLHLRAVTSEQTLLWTLQKKH